MLVSRQDLTRTLLAPVVLACLLRDRHYGWSLMSEVNRLGIVDARQGTVYPLLNRLEDAGLISSEWDTASGPRPRRYYRLTAAGRRELEDFQAEWAHLAGTLTGLLTEHRSES